MKKTLMLIAVALAMALPITAASAVPVAVWDQGFETDTDGWLDSDNGWDGSIEASAGVATVQEGDTGPFSRFDGYRDTWPGTWTAELDVKLDPGAWASGEGFDYSVASRGTDNAHDRDYIFHVTQDTSTGALYVAGSNNSNFAPIDDLETRNSYEVTEAGWYTLQHVFYESGGSLAVDMNLLDSDGAVLFTETRAPGGDQTIPAEVGGNMYAWFTHVTVDGGITVDNHQLFLQGPETKDDCKQGGYEDFYGVYSSQGECVSDVAADGSGSQGKAKGKNK